MRKLRRGVGAFLLSLWIPGLGQVFNSQLLLGTILFLGYLAIVASAALFHVALSFRSGVAYLFVLWAFGLGVAIVAGRTAIHQVAANSVQKLRWPSYLLGAVFVSSALIPALSKTSPQAVFGVRAFKIPSDSMAPTILNNDRIIVDMGYYKTHRPGRGDLVVYSMPRFNVLYIKRIVAIGGDTIVTDSRGTILNGNRISEPYAYFEGKSDADSDKFGPLTVPMNQVFLMGDNRDNSYDSRYTGTVGVDHVLGKALYIYYSSGRLDRIGRKVE